MPTIDWPTIADAVVGTCDSVPAIADRFDIAEDIIEEGLFDHDVEVCPGCGWWFASFELVTDEGDDEPVCDDCAPTSGSSGESDT